jgi:hypothetical protein
VAAIDTSSGPRLFGIPASRAPVVAIIRRGPSDWCHVGRWDVAAARYEPGAWLKGTIAPQKCDLSPDGRWLAYSAVKYPGSWEAGPVYEAISRLPWLTALAAWEAGTTYTRGIHFTDEPGESALGSPTVGSVAPLLSQFGLAVTPAVQFAVERRHGWIEAAATPPRDQGGPWDERRVVTMEKSRPGAPGGFLLVSGSYAAFRSFPQWHETIEYALVDDDTTQPLGDVQWADWDRTGRLLVATTSGRLQIRDLEGEGMQIRFDFDLAELAPDPQPAPDWATTWATAQRTD